MTVSRQISGAPRLYVGVDGGGSTCRVRVCDVDGRLLGTGTGGPANVSLDASRAVQTVCDTLRDTFVSAGLPPAATADASVAIGLAGASSPGIAATLRERLPPFGHTVVTSDAEIACLGAHGGEDGGLVIAGTGSVAVLMAEGRTTTFGGRGFLLGDDGSGAVIGREIWRKALRALDGLEPTSSLLDALLGEVERDPATAVRWGRSATSADFARYAPHVLAAAADGDGAALAVARQAGHSITELIQALDQRGARRICFVGGLSPFLRAWLDPHATALLSEPKADALDGALILAGAPLAFRLPAPAPESCNDAPSR